MSITELLKLKGGRLVLDAALASATPGIKDRAEAEQLTEDMQDIIGERQERLFINGAQSVLVVLQGMDASGKDGCVKKVFRNVNPAGMEVTSFKQPTPIEKLHDFLWRIHAAVPPHGKIGVFNRSHYEDVAVVRVNSDKLLTKEQQAQKDIWEWRFKLINGFEQMLVRSGTVVLKFFLHISRDEQLQRFQSRQNDPEKNWKLNWGDFEERQHWDSYMEAYADCIRATNTEYAPWFIIPSDRKWYRNFAVASVLGEALQEMKLPAPKASDPALLTAKIT